MPGILHLQPYWERTFSDKSQFSCSSGLSSNYTSALWQYQMAYTQLYVHIHMNQYIYACKHMLSFRECNGLNLHSIFKITPKVTSSPTKPEFSRNIAKQKHNILPLFSNRRVLWKAFSHSWSWLPRGLSHFDLSFFFFFPICGKHNHIEIIHSHAC